MSKAYADLPLHYGKVPQWLYERMSLLGGEIVEAVVHEYGKSALLTKMSDPFWFQSLGCVLGMDWHSSGITTSVLGALKQSVNKRSKELGIYICGGKGKHSLATPAELIKIAEHTGLNGAELVKQSKLVANVDSSAIQDGYQIYLHSFILSNDGEWAVIQQGMNDGNAMARRYHWHSPSVQSFVEEPHSFVYGHNKGAILNITDTNAVTTKQGILEIIREQPDKVMYEAKKLLMPRHHYVRSKDVNLKRLGSILAVAHNADLRDIESLLLLKGVGPRTIQSLALVSEVIHGTPTRFKDPARYSFAHGGKDGHPFPVPTKVFDESIAILDKAIQLSKLGYKDKSNAIKGLHKASLRIEEDFTPNNKFDELIEKERKDSWKYGGKTVFGDAKPPNNQLSLF